jgi:hypothetical protein
MIFNVVFWPLRGWLLKLEKGLFDPVWPRQMKIIQYRVENALPTRSDTWCIRLNLGIAAGAASDDAQGLVKRSRANKRTPA